MGSYTSPLFTYAPAFKQLVHTDEPPQRPPSLSLCSPVGIPHSARHQGRVEAKHTKASTHEYTFADSVRGDHSSTEAIATHSTATTQRETATRPDPPRFTTPTIRLAPGTGLASILYTYLHPDTSEPDDLFTPPPPGPWRSVCLGTSGPQANSNTPASDRRFPRTIWNRYVSH